MAAEGHKGRRSDEAPGRSRRRTAFVLSGGGPKGACQVGMLRALLDAGVMPDALYGVSVGALNAVGYASDPTMEGIAGLERLWRRLRSRDIFPQGRLGGPWQFIQRRPSAFGADGLRRVITSALRFPRLEQNCLPVSVVATSVVTGEERWMSDGDALSALLASTAQPGLLPPVERDGDLLIDGGVVSNVPVSTAVSQGADRIFVLYCGRIDAVPPMSDIPLGMMLSASALARAALVRRELRDVPEHVELTLIECPEAEALSWRDFSRSAMLVGAGYQAASNMLASLGAPELQAVG